jgi:signal transduction histidine kinase
VATIASLRDRLLRPTIRVRLTAMYGGLFYVVGSALLIAVYLIARQALREPPTSTRVRGVGPGGGPPLGNAQPLPDSALPTGPNPADLPGAHGVQRTPNGNSIEEIRQYGDHALRSMLITSAVCLVVLTLVAVVLGWYMSGRVLRPLHGITSTARRLSEHDLDQRIALAGPEDELKELADTFDGMLARLQAAFESQRRFIANASHELRTPLAVQRAALQIDLPGASPAEVPRIAEELLAVNRHSERLIDGLLALARSEAGLGERVPVSVSRLALDVVHSCRAEAAAADVSLHASVDDADVGGDRALLHQLLTNLVQNGIRHNDAGGEVTVRVDASGIVTVGNTGPIVPADRVCELFEPFRQLSPDRTGPATGAGLGLSIVRAIAVAHGGAVAATPNAGGGLTVEVRLADR